MDIVREDGVGFQVLHPEILAVGRSDGLWHGAAQDRGASPFGGDAVGVGIQEDATRSSGDEGVQAELVGHCACDYEHAVFASGDVGYMGLEVTCRFVLSEYIVTEGRFYDGGEHTKAWAGDYIACKIMSFAIINADNGKTYS